MQPDVEVAPFAEGHMREVWRLWEAQYREEVAASGALQASWSSRGEEAGAFLRELILLALAVGIAFGVAVGT